MREKSANKALQGTSRQRGFPELNLAGRGISIMHKTESILNYWLLLH